MPKKNPKKKTPRAKKKYPQFDAKYSPRIRAEYMDYAGNEYAKDLPEDEFVELEDGTKISVKEWYHKFVSEFDGASLNFKDLSKNLHNTKDLKKDCTDRNNARNRCIYGIAKAGGKVIDDNRIDNDYTPLNVSDTEDAIIDIIDAKYLDYDED